MNVDVLPVVDHRQVRVLLLRHDEKLSAEFLYALNFLHLCFLLQEELVFEGRICYKLRKDIHLERRAILSQCAEHPNDLGLVPLFFNNLLDHVLDELHALWSCPDQHHSLAEYLGCVQI